MKLQPLRDRVLVKRIKEEETKTKSGIIVSFSPQEEAVQLGTVIAVGTGKVTDAGKDIPLRLKVKDKVCFPKYAGISFDDEHIILKEDEILGIIS